MGNLLTKREIKSLASAVENAESNTSGEIATAIINESESYSGFELNFAILIGFIYFFIAQFFTPQIRAFLENIFWDYSDNYLVMFYGFSIFLVIFISYFALNLQVLDRLIIPKSVMLQKVHNRALRHFVESGVSNTKNRTGILIFISVLERRVELIADRGISEKIETGKWQEIVNNIISGIKEGEIAPKLIESIEECGKLLSEHFPIQENDKNELSNTIAILED